MTKLTESVIEDFAIEQFEELSCQYVHESGFQNELSDKIGQLKTITKGNDQDK